MGKNFVPLVKTVPIRWVRRISFAGAFKLRSITRDVTKSV